MKVEQIYTGCLSQGSYFIECCNEAVVIDPLRDIDVYLTMAKERGVTIKYIFETHFHADFVSGHLDLSKATGAPIVYGPNATPTFNAHIATDGEEFTFGKVKIKTLHTPGHTVESTTFLLLDKQGENHAIFTGDTLFLGDVGRPDLAQKAGELTQEDLAGMLFDSLRNKILPLEDEVIVYPGHGAGSACGKHMMKETVDTLGNQKRMNYALRTDMTKDEFIKEVTAGLLPPPAYFPQNVSLNKTGYGKVNTVVEKGLNPLTSDQVEALIKDVVVLDVRAPHEFAENHIPGSIFVGLDGSFAPWVGEVLGDVNQKIILVTPSNREEEAVLRLARIGFDNVVGYLKDGIAAWKNDNKEVATLPTIEAKELPEFLENDNVMVDVRKTTEHLSEHVIGATNIPLSELKNRLSELPTTKNLMLYCAGGYRSTIAASILKANNVHQLTNIAGGFAAIKDVDVPKSNYVCPSTLVG